MRRMLAWTAAVLAVGAAGWWWLVADSRMPAEANYRLDLAEVRRLAQAMPGERPTALHYEHVATLRFPQAMIAAGAPWTLTEMPVYAYQLQTPQGTIVIDAAHPRALAQPAFIQSHYDDAAFSRVGHALETARLIVVTHEHMDHIGGVLGHPRLAALRPALRLTDAQLAHPERMKPAVLPAGVLDGYKPLRYSGQLALAPGVVVIAAPGHTPGSQMVYVQMADGRELLLLGDVAWKAGNVIERRQRPRFATALIREQRDAVFGQLRSLHALALEYPELHQVPGHDAEVIGRLESRGIVQRGFLRSAGQRS